MDLGRSVDVMRACGKAVLDFQGPDDLSDWLAKA